MATSILGISAFYHDSAACLISDGLILAAAQEERFTRKKHDASFPKNAIRYCLQEAGLEPHELKLAVFYENPYAKFDRLIETYFTLAPKGIGSFMAAMRSWLGRKLFIRQIIERELLSLADGRSVKGLPEIVFTEHHQSHAASAFYPSGFQRASVLCMDGVGEWATTSGWLGEGGSLQQLWEIAFPHSIGLLYSAFTYHAGFKVNSGEYKLMGLAPYGKPTYVQLIYDHLIDLKPDGSFRLNLDYFDYCTGSKMTNERFSGIFGGPPRTPESRLTERDLDLACSIQYVVEEIVMRLARTLGRETGTSSLCLSGGVALNCVANGRLLREAGFERIWVQPAAGDAGGALGAAFAAWHGQGVQQQQPCDDEDLMLGGFLGPAFTAQQVERFLNGIGARHTRMNDSDLLNTVADALASDKIIGWFHGRMEFGPRALGARSILANPLSSNMQSNLNLKVKYRESFRPFAPVVTRENVSDYFDLDCDSPYMQFVAAVRQERRLSDTGTEVVDPLERINLPRSVIPAVTHVDYSARIQTVTKESNSRLYGLLKHFEARTGCPVLVNTSFNVRGEPIVCSPEDAYRCFMRTGMDMLVIENSLLRKEDQIKLTNYGSNEINAFD